MQQIPFLRDRVLRFTPTARTERSGPGLLQPFTSDAAGVDWMTSLVRGRLPSWRLLVFFFSL